MELWRQNQFVGRRFDNGNEGQTKTAKQTTVNAPGVTSTSRVILTQDSCQRHGLAVLPWIQVLTDHQQALTARIQCLNIPTQQLRKFLRQNGAE